MAYLQLAYISVAAHDFDAEALSTLMRQCRRRNREDEITGILLYEDGQFLQVLEGTEDTVRSAYVRIQQDPRHRGVETICERRIPHREFGRWNMGLRILGDGGPVELVELDARVAQLIRDVRNPGDTLMPLVKRYRELEYDCLSADLLRTA